ncbi:ATP-dependent helicase [Methylobacterium sp. J-070]|uniref:ATP-dependent helicase n=1 Tax=Methylobacterium sp. J-070 TaxID=2836650 RepID=UPI001FBA0029|nr:ATP-dependent helicase [Methylobacterium sp. J-070]MCJ2054940.1 ATP-dependent helicase [Methylobacterium sp. J-070]
MGESAEATPTNETLRRELATIQAELSRTVAALERERERTEAVRIVLNAVLASLPNRGLNRRQFHAIVAQAGRETPDEGPQAVRHTILLTEARRVLGIDVNAPL